jgi:hypothetical protein
MSRFVAQGSELDRPCGKMYVMANGRDISGLIVRSLLLVRVTKIFLRIRQGGMYERVDKCIGNFDGNV